MTLMVADSSALILLAKCNLLEIVCDLFDVIVPKAVSIEVASEDLIKNYPDAALISELMSKGTIKIQSPGRDRAPSPLSLHKGEKETLSGIKKSTSKKCKTILIDSCQIVSLLS